MLRARGSDAARHRRAARCGRDHCIAARGCARTRHRRARARTRRDARVVRRAARGSCRDDRASREPRSVGRWRYRRNLGERAERDGGLLATSGCDGGKFRRACRRALAAHRRSGLSARWRPLRGWTRQGSADRARAQSLSARSRTRDRTRRGARAARARRGLRGADRRHGMHRRGGRGVAQRAQARDARGTGVGGERGGRARVRRAGRCCRAARTGRAAEDIERQGAARRVREALRRTLARSVCVVREGRAHRWRDDGASAARYVYEHRDAARRDLEQGARRRAHEPRRQLLPARRQFARRGARRGRRERAVAHRLRCTRRVHRVFLALGGGRDREAQRGGRAASPRAVRAARAGSAPHRARFACAARAMDDLGARSREQRIQHERRAVDGRPFAGRCDAARLRHARRAARHPARAFRARRRWRADADHRR
ncbi:hypothetical protein AWB80_08232 [Caballeronia pedi]|uniref:Uncharacterized protein n=1 Tax=Caballeronia pedi TaxID=1777141 RepID=A0A158E511_9BURK|nr:hypothetical protein AWB80_08232 [Caballeronia pedi]